MAATLKTTVIQEPSSGTVNMTLGSTGGVTFGSSITSNTITSAASTALNIQSAGFTAMTIDTSQNVGIGTTSPNYQFQSYKAGAVANYLQVGSGATGAGAANGTLFGVDASGNGIVNVQGSVNYITSVAGTERMRIDSSGNLLVGTTARGGVNSNSFDLDVTNAILYQNHVNGTASGASYNYYSYNGTGIGSITQNGTTAVAFNTTSDYRLKENVTPMTTGLATISALKPVNYDWISDKSAGEGFIAHELQAIIPNAVTGEKDAVDEDGKPIHQGVDYSKIVVHLVAALQELSAKVDAQAVEITALQAKVGA